MRIALFAETYLPDINGVVTHVKILKDGLEKLGHQVLIVTASPRTRRYRLENGVLYCPAAAIKKFYGFGVAVPYSPRRTKFVKDFNPDIIHIHQEFGIGLSGVQIAKHLDIPLVYTLHTMYDDYLYYVAPDPLIPAVKKASHRYIRFLARNANALTGPSKKCEDYFRQIGITKEVNIIPNAVELDAFLKENLDKQKAIEYKNKFAIPENKTVAVFVGRLGSEKSVEVSLEYFAQAVKDEDNFHFIIVGDGPVKPELENLTKKLGIENMVTFTGAIPHNELPPLFDLCDIYLTSSLSDTNSISMLEGMAAGLPVLQRLDPVNADQVIENVNGYLFNSAEELGQKLKTFQKLDSDERLALNNNVLNSVLSSGATTLATSLLEVYKKAQRSPVIKY